MDKIPYINPYEHYDIADEFGDYMPASYSDVQRMQRSREAEQSQTQMISQVLSMLK